MALVQLIGVKALKHSRRQRSRRKLQFRAPRASWAQKKYLNRKERYFVFVAGRRSGKTDVVALDIILKALRRRGVMIAYVAPTYAQAREIMFERVKGYLLRSGYTRRSMVRSSSPPRIDLINGSKIYFFGANNADAIRGHGFNEVYFDEFADIPLEAWVEVAQPTLAETKGGATFIGTPKGKANHLYDLYEQAGISEDWGRLHCTTIDSGIVDAEEVERARRNLDTRTFEQEYLASFVTLGNTTYYGFVDECVVDEVDLLLGEPVIMCWDFNAGEKPMSVCLVQRQRDGWYKVIKDFQFKNTNTPEMCEAVAAWLDAQGYDYPIEVVGDYSGTKRVSVASISDFRIIGDYFRNYGAASMQAKSRGHRFKVTHRPTLSIRDRVAATNSLFQSKTPNGEPRLRVCKNCVNLIEDLRRVEWKASGSGLDDRDDKRTHLTDALSYFAYNYHPIDSYLPKVKEAR